MSKGREQEVYRRGNPKGSIKKMSNSLLIRGIQIKTMRSCFISVTLAKLETRTILRVDGLVDIQSLLCTVGGSGDEGSHPEVQLGTNGHIRGRDTAVPLQMMSPREVLTKIQKEVQERTFIPTLCRRGLEAVQCSLLGQLCAATRNNGLPMHTATQADLQKQCYVEKVRN